MQEFYHNNKRPTTIASEPGKKIESQYKMITNELGIEELVEVGKTNIYEKIQANKESTLINNIIERYNNGDVQALNQRQPVYGDTTQMPKNLAEAQQMVINAERYYNSLPNEIKQKLNNSKEEFFESTTNGEFEIILNDYYNSVKPKQQEQKESDNNGNV